MLARLGPEGCRRHFACRRAGRGLSFPTPDEYRSGLGTGDSDGITFSIIHRTERVYGPMYASRRRRSSIGFARWAAGTRHVSRFVSGEAGGMDAHSSCKRDTEALIEAIWGPKAAGVPELIDPIVRVQQNHALAAAIKAYLQLYLLEIHSPLPGPDDPPKYVG